MEDIMLDNPVVEITYESIEIMEKNVSISEEMAIHRVLYGGSYYLMLVSASDRATYCLNFWTKLQGKVTPIPRFFCYTPHGTGLLVLDMKSLLDVIKNQDTSLCDIFRQLLELAQMLELNNVAAMQICLPNLFINSSGKVYLWGLSHPYGVDTKRSIPMFFSDSEKLASAPELLLKVEIDFSRADIWSVGKVILQILLIHDKRMTEPDAMKWITQLRGKLLKQDFPGVEIPANFCIDTYSKQEDCPLAAMLDDCRIPQELCDLLIAITDPSPSHRLSAKIAVESFATNRTMMERWEASRVKAGPSGTAHTKTEEKPIVPVSVEREGANSISHSNETTPDSKGKKRERGEQQQALTKKIHVAGNSGTNFVNNNNLLNSASCYGGSRASSTSTTNTTNGSNSSTSTSTSTSTNSNSNSNSSSSTSTNSNSNSSSSLSSSTSTSSSSSTSPSTSSSTNSSSSANSTTNSSDIDNDTSSSTTTKSKKQKSSILPVPSARTPTGGPQGRLGQISVQMQKLSVFSLFAVEQSTRNMESLAALKNLRYLKDAPNPRALRALNSLFAIPDLAKTKVKPNIFSALSDLSGLDGGCCKIMAGLSHLQKCHFPGAKHLKCLEVLGQVGNRNVNMDIIVIKALGALAALSKLASVDPSLEGFRNFELIVEWTNKL